MTRVPRIDAVPELLVFRHPRAGVQLPAGSVEPDEAWEAAAEREVREETALEGAKLVGKLGELEILLPETQAIVRAATNVTGWAWARIPRGLTVDVEPRLGDASWSYVRYREFAGAEAPPDRGFEVAGWVPSAALTRRVLRHFFHLHFAGDSPPGPWEVHADGHVFRPFWTPLELAGSPLHPRQLPWLEQVYTDLLRSARRLARPEPKSRARRK